MPTFYAVISESYEAEIATNALTAAKRVVEYYGANLDEDGNVVTVAEVAKMLRKGVDVRLLEEGASEWTYKIEAKSLFLKPAKKAKKG